MSSELQSHEDFIQRRRQRLELRHRRAQFILAGAQAAYEAVRKMPCADNSGLREALQRIERAREQLVDIQSAIEFLEDQECMA